jgi:hypothetical protein
MYAVDNKKGNIILARKFMNVIFPFLRKYTAFDKKGTKSLLLACDVFKEIRLSGAKNDLMSQNHINVRLVNDTNIDIYIDIEKNRENKTMYYKIVKYEEDDDTNEKPEYLAYTRQDLVSLLLDLLSDLATKISMIKLVFKNTVDNNYHDKLFYEYPIGIIWNKDDSVEYDFIRGILENQNIHYSKLDKRGKNLFDKNIHEKFRYSSLLDYDNNYKILLVEKENEKNIHLQEEYLKEYNKNIKKSEKPTEEKKQQKKNDIKVDHAVSKVAPNMQKDVYECDECFTINKASDLECVACGKVHKVKCIFCDTIFSNTVKYCDRCNVCKFCKVTSGCKCDLDASGKLRKN